METLTDEILISSLTFSDLPNLATIRKDCFEPEYIETDEGTQKLYEIFPTGCLGCFVQTPIGRSLIGYALTLPWLTTENHLLPPDDITYVRLPSHWDSYYIHDFAIDPKYQRIGLGRLLLKKVEGVSKDLGIKKLILISILDSVRAWSRLGFVGVESVIYAESEYLYMEKDI
eukprot:TRINITY_DN4968_c0_g1_i1.p1 TRINITY_DN4968_c0_g1~~TRINITY_DN4968_c0_g1_i1.p1  ORF type:complete len:172 (-),score=23.78 TRINITY_DN4968_c0_g1_i1:34-549(-)